MEISQEELNRRAAEADRARATLRRATLELVAVKKQLLEQHKLDKMRMNLVDPATALSAAMQAVEAGSPQHPGQQKPKGTRSHQNPKRVRTVTKQNH